MSVRVFYEILNQRGTPAMFTDTLANRPTFGFAGRLFVSTDSGQIFEDTGSAWTLVADAGVGGGTLSSVCLNGNTTATGIVITAGGLSTNSLTDTALTAGSIPFITTGGVFSQDNANLFWDNTNKFLGINTNAAGAYLDIHMVSNIGIQLNNTTTGNSNIAFQNASVGKWRIGNVYNGGANSFDIYNVSSSTTILSINNTTNIPNFYTNLIINSVNVGKGGGSGASNTLLGDQALGVLTTGYANVAVGYKSLYSNTTGNNNTSIGESALISLISSDNNTAVGNFTLNQVTTGSHNTAFGKSAGQTITTGSYNTIIGPNNTLGITTGSYNTIIGGSLISLSTSLSNNIILADGQANVKYRWDGTNNNLYGNVIFSSTIGNGTYTYTLPSATGTLALTSDIPSLSNYVTLNGTQTITGAKTFQTTTTFQSTINITAGTNVNFGTTDTGALFLRSNNINNVTLFSNGNTGIYTGGSDTGERFQVNGTARFFSTIYSGVITADSGSTGVPSIYAIVSGGGNSGTYGFGGNTDYKIRSGSDYGAMIFDIAGAERFRIGSAGQILQSTVIGDWSYQMLNTNSSSPNGLTIGYNNSGVNGTANPFLYCVGNSGTTLRMEVRSNGGIANYATNNVVLSDERLKKDIILLESVWDKIKNIEIVKYKFKDQSHNDFNMGVIAQQVELIAPELIDIDGWNITKKDNTKYKSVYETDLNYYSIKALQEAMIKIEELNEKLIRNNIN